MRRCLTVTPYSPCFHYCFHCSQQYETMYCGFWRWTNTYVPSESLTSVVHQHLCDWLLNSCNRASGRKARASSLYSQPVAITVSCASLEPQPRGIEVWFFWTGACSLWSNHKTAVALRNTAHSNKYTELRLYHSINVDNVVRSLKRYIQYIYHPALVSLRVLRFCNWLSILYFLLSLGSPPFPCAPM